MDYSQYTLEKTGYLKEEFRLFHINDRTDREFSYHYHDFHKIIVFLSGKVTYHIEGKAYHLKPRDILLVSQGAIHKPEIDPSVPYERYIFWIRDDLSMQELNTCFQKATDHSFNLVRIDSAVQEHLRDLLRELENSIKNKDLVMKYSAMLFLRNLWFMSIEFFCRPVQFLTVDLILLILKLNSF